MGLFNNLEQKDVPRLESLKDRKIRLKKMTQLTTKTAKRLKEIEIYLKNAKKNHDHSIIGLCQCDTTKSERQVIINVKNELKENLDDRQFVRILIREIESVENEPKQYNKK